MNIVRSFSPPPKKQEKGMQQLYNEKGTQGTTGKEGEPLGNPLNHHAPRWQTLRNESTGKDRRGHHRKPPGKTDSPRYRGRRWAATISVHHLVVTLTCEQHTENQQKTLHMTQGF